MISQTSITAFMVLIGYSVIMPLLFYILLKNKEKKDIRFYLIGMATYLISSLIVKSFIIQFADYSLDLESMMIGNFSSYVIILSMISAVVEVIAIYTAIRFFAKNKISYKTGYLIAVGYGAVEAILLLGFSYMNYLNYAQMINDGSLMALVGQDGITQAMVDLVVLELQAFKLEHVFINILDYFVLMLIHISISVFIMEAIMNYRFWVAIVVGIIFRASLDIFNALLSPSLGVYTEIIIVIYGLAAGYYLITSYRRMKGQMVELV